MKNKTLFSVTGLVLTGLFLLIAVAIISSFPRLRIDLTQDRLYTLAEGTRSIVRSLDRPLEVIFFYSDEATADMPQLRAYGTRVQELLNEMAIASNGNLSVRVVDPQPFSVQEDMATEYGIQAVPLAQGREEVYFGLTVLDPATDTEEHSRAGTKIFETMPLIRPDQEEFLEYEFSRMITAVAEPQPRVIGLMTMLDIDGGINPATGTPLQPWAIMESIRYLYDTRRISPFAEVIDEDIDVLMIVHPQDLEEQTLYAIDQFVLGGGSVLAFVDPVSDMQSQAMMSGADVFETLGSDLGPLFETWGLDYQSNQVVTDRELALFVNIGQSQRPVTHLGMLGVQRNFFANDIVSGRLEVMNMSSVGALRPLPDASTTFEPLVFSSDQSMLMDSAFFREMTDPGILINEFVPGGERQVLAARLTGPVNSAFPDGAPVRPGEQNGETDADEAAAQPQQHLTRSTGDISVIVVADTDLLANRLWAQQQNILGQRVIHAFASNADFIVNALDNLSGSTELISIRSRGRFARPFTRVLDLQRAADERLRQEETNLLNTLSETEQQIMALSQGEQGDTFNPQQEAEIDRFIQQQLETRRRLRDVRHQLNRDIDNLGSRLKLINTALIPTLLVIGVLIASLLRSRRRRQS